MLDRRVMETERKLEEMHKQLRTLYTKNLIVWCWIRSIDENTCEIFVAISSHTRNCYGTVFIGKCVYVYTGT
jgi:hypothetical protein